MGEHAPVAGPYRSGRPCAKRAEERLAPLRPLAAELAAYCLMTQTLISGFTSACRRIGTR